MKPEERHISFQPFHPEDRVVLALSGGPDSVFLGEMLKRDNFQNVITAHFNHRLRGRASDDDQIFCSKYAGMKSWTYETEEWKTPMKGEESARDARYDFLFRVLKTHDAKAIFLAHHGDDQVETIFFQFIRGTGVKGLSGMERWDEKRKLFRPLLPLRKKEIVSFLENDRIPYCRDKTNEEADAFDRNFLRLTLIPMIEKRFPHFHETILRNSELYASTSKFLEEESGMRKKEISRTLENGKGECSYDRNAFFLLPPVLRSEILRSFFRNAIPSFLQVREIEEFLRTAQSGKRKSLFGVEFLVYAGHFFVD